MRLIIEGITISGETVTGLLYIAGGQAYVQYTDETRGLVAVAIDRIGKYICIDIEASPK